MERLMSSPYLPTLLRGRNMGYSEEGTIALGALGAVQKSEQKYFLLLLHFLLLLYCACSASAGGLVACVRDGRDGEMRSSNTGFRFCTK